jgi:Flp pilus assembly protein TadD
MEADALEGAREAAMLSPKDVSSAEQVASLLADAGDVTALDRAVESLRQIAPRGGSTLFYAAVSAFLHGRPEETVALGRQAVKADPSMAPVHDLLGAAHTKLGQLPEARDAFLTSLRFDPHDSTAYTNLGLVELAAGNRDAARRYFAEALNLTPSSTAAREGLAQASR